MMIPGQKVSHTAGVHSMEQPVSIISFPYITRRLLYEWILIKFHLSNNRLIILLLFYMPHSATFKSSCKISLQPNTILWLNNTSYYNQNLTTQMGGYDKLLRFLHRFFGTALLLLLLLLYRLLSLQHVEVLLHILLQN